MAFYQVGDLVKKLRTQQGLTQEDLADGIIDKTNLSRLENGIQIPQKASLDALLQRLGVNPQSTYCYYLNQANYDFYIKKEKLQLLLFEKKNEEAVALIEELASLPNFSEKTEKQFIISARISIMINRKDETENCRNLIFTALSLTIPSFNEKYISDYLFTDQEIRLVNMLSIIYFYENNLEKAIEILYKLKNSLESSPMDKKEKSRLLPMILYNLTKYLGLSKRYAEAIELCDCAKRVCIESNNMQFLPQITFNKACDLYELGDIDSCRRLVYQAYYGSDMYESYKDKSQIKAYAKEHFGMEID